MVEVWTHLSTAYAKVAPQLCEKAEYYAKVSYKICIGEDETFDEKVGRVVHQAIFEGTDLGTAFRRMNVR